MPKLALLGAPTPSPTRNNTKHTSAEGVLLNLGGLAQSFRGRGVAQTCYSHDLQRFKVEFKVDPFMIPRGSDLDST